MKPPYPKAIFDFLRCKSAVTFCLAIVLTASGTANADEADAKRLLKAMSDYLAAQQDIAFAYDSILEVVTQDGQTLSLASSGEVSLKRPDKLHVTRAGGFADVDMHFDGKTMTILGKNLNIYTEIEAPGTIDQLADVMRDQYNRPLPAADLLLSNPYELLMEGVVDVKDLGSGVIGGVECDFLAFRTEEVDWQIWIAQGERPYPCRFVITSTVIVGGPQYSIQVRDWKTGDEVAASDFSFTNSTNATRVELENLEGAGDLPSHFTKGEAQ